jgi:hypothetical protein
LLCSTAKTRGKNGDMKIYVLKCNLVQLGDNFPQFADLQREIRERESD